MARVTPYSFVAIPISYLVIQYMMDSEMDICIPSSSSVASFFLVIGVAVSMVFVVKYVLGVGYLIRLYLLPRIFAEKDYVTTYGKWAVITGGSDGIGKAYAMELAKRGMNIFILSNNENGVVSAIKNKYQNVEAIHLEVEFSSTEVYEEIEKELSALEDIGILINNVGMFHTRVQPLSDQKSGYFKKIMNVNMAAMVLMTELLLKKMMVKNRGLIVNMGSLFSVIPLPYATMYSSSKAFVETFSVCLAAELNEVNVKVKCLQPGFVRTRLLKEVEELTNFLSSSFFLNMTFPDAEGFAASAVPTFGCTTPIVYTGYWTHEISLALVASISVGKARIAAVIKSIIRWLMQDV